MDRRRGFGEFGGGDVGGSGSRREGGKGGGVRAFGSPRATPRDGQGVHREAAARAPRGAEGGGARAHQAAHTATGAILAEPRRRLGQDAQG